MATATGTTRTTPARRTQPLRLPRTTGALSGLLVIVLGVWGGLIPFIGPYFHYSFGGDQTWHFTMQRLWLDILPGAVAVLGGLMLLRASSRIGGLTAGWIALIAGAWFAVGPAVSLLWDQNIYAIGAPNGGSVRRMLEWVGYFHGLGVVIVGLSAFAMGRFFSRPRVAEEAAVVAADAAAAETHGRRGTATRAAVAEAPAERTVVRDTPAEERRAVADAPATEARASDEPVAGTRSTDTRAADARAAETRAAETRAAETRTVDTRTANEAPTTVTPAETTAGPASTTGPATTTGSASTAAPTATGTRRRSGGLLGRFRH
jgi:hypothetical protein